ncbi:MAG: aromatic ring-hydroxylating dioxygenase subunit alpha [Anaerolineales bacterium]|nr:aromatic ring-hydroxylating dioxygenase subunit alpha [Anaerolineales bacterium]
MATYFKTADTYVAGSMTLPQEYYTSHDVFQREKERIFKHGWMCVGHQSRIAHVGEYFLASVFDESIIVLRDKQDNIRAFYNVCRHRGTRICEENEGQFKGSIQCSYHAWTYGLDGTLIGAPFMKEVEGFRWEEFPLRSVHVHVWEGFIFINLSMDTPEPFETMYEPMLNRLTRWNVGGLKVHTRHVYEAASNWKYVFQNFNECYHCPTIHPMLNKYTNYTSAENDLFDGSMLGGFMNITGGDSMTMSGRLCGLPLGDLSSGIEKRGFYYTMLPNLLINIHPDYLMYHMLLPVAPGHTTIVSEWLFNPESFGLPDFRPQEAVDFWHETNLQDWQVCELSQQGVTSQGYTPGWYSPRESLLAAFDREYLRIME